MFYLFTNHSKSALFLFLGHLTKGPVFLLVVEWGECMVCDLWVVRMRVSGVRWLTLSSHCPIRLQRPAFSGRLQEHRYNSDGLWPVCVHGKACLVMVHYPCVCVHGKVCLLMVHDPCVPEIVRSLYYWSWRSSDSLWSLLISSYYGSPSICSLREFPVFLDLC